MHKTKRLAVVVGMLALVSVTLADVPRLVSYQGRLTGNGDDPVNLRIRFYDAATDGNLLFEETHDAVQRQNGLFTILIGSTHPDGQGVKDEHLATTTGELWLQVSVHDGNDWIDLTPRTRLVMVPYAAKSKVAEGLVTPGAFDQALHVDADGNVGIGSANPAGRLDVHGDVYVGTGTDSENHKLVFRGPNQPENSDSHQDISFEFAGGPSAKIRAYRGQSWTSYLEFLTNSDTSGADDPQVRVLISENGETRFYGPVNVRNQSGDVTVELRGFDTGTEGGNIRLYNEGGANTALLSGTRHTDDGGNGALILRDKNGVNRIMLDADDNGVGTTTTQILQITGGSDLAEPFCVAGLKDGSSAAKPGMVVSIDPQQPGKLRISAKPYDPKVAGVISGAKGLQPGMVMKAEGQEHADGEHPVALTGRVWCWCDASFGAIQPGDRLTTSATPGHAMKVIDNDKAPGAVIGKAMTPLAQGRGLVLVLVNLQ